MALLRKMELSIGEIAQVLGQSQPRISRHVKILCDAGLAIRRREGSWTFLQPGVGIRMHALFNTLDILRNETDSQSVESADSARLAAVRADRIAFAADFFAQHAHDWDAMRSLHGAEADVEAKILYALSAQPVGTLLDVGTGTGRMLELFAGHAEKVIGIDRSPEMLRFARAKLIQESFHNVELLQGDIHALPLSQSSVDTIILHQVLHYLPTPESAIAELARVLKPLGRVLIVDFASHDLEELRTRNAHARLGFSDDQIQQWFAAAGLQCEYVDALIGHPLTVKIWRGVKMPQKVAQ